ncbi:hypothetical protein PVAG01_08206 [Phlyctema vagabunda]|uniref:Rhodopsin domain-containing protein n=1 Tax=Phlyctema vagabunda TaxID=108571 RepID=A0ABR4P8S7_9HELO
MAASELSQDAFNTLIILWVFTFCSVAVMGLRLAMRRYREQKFNLSDYLTMACIFCLLIRVGCIHVVLYWGTNNMSPKLRAATVFTPQEIYEREIGSKLTLVNRPFYNTYIWLQKAVVMLLIERVLGGLWWTENIMKLYWAILAATYVACQIITFAECDPFPLYWQVVPAPGKCSQALVQLVVLGVLNIVTDLMLIGLPLPTLFGLKTTWASRFRLVGLFSLGMLVVVVTIVRLPLNVTNVTLQNNRTTWASTEAFAAALVANIPTLYTLRRRKTENLSTPKKTAWQGSGSHLGSHFTNPRSTRSRKVDEEILDLEYGNRSNGIMVHTSIEMFDRSTALESRKSEKSGDTTPGEYVYERGVSQENLIVTDVQAAHLGP